MTDSILIFGGTFDPPHLAHSALPPLVARELRCARIIYVPAAISPLKADCPPAPAAHRLAMLRIALRDLHSAEISTIELDRPGPSFTIDTIECLQHGLAQNVDLRLLIGSDQATDFQRWRRWKDILELAPPAVILRPPLDRDIFAAQLSQCWDAAMIARWLGWTVDVPLMDISATEIRRRLASGDSTDGLVDADVRRYIEQHGLYGFRGTAAVAPQASVPANSSSGRTPPRRER